MSAATATTAPRLPRAIRIGGPVSRPPDVLTPHSDKAISQRAILLAALSDGRSRVRDAADCLDVRANITALRRAGLDLATHGADVIVTGVDGRALKSATAKLDAGNSATTSRLLLAVLAGGRSDVVVTGNAALCARPMGEVVEPLRRLGGVLETCGAQGRLPIRVRGTRLHGGAVDVEVDSAQPVSALLFAGVLADGPVQVRRRTAARDHTERLLRWTGLEVDETPQWVTVVPGRPEAFDLTVPGDPSGAALLAALHLAAREREGVLHLAGVGLNERRTGFFELLRRMGVDLAVLEGRELPDGPERVGTLSLRRTGALQGVDVAGAGLVQSAIDELPMLAALATGAEQETVIRNATELKTKDTNRISATVALLRAFGADADVTHDGMVIGPSVLQPPRSVDLPADHRIVFAAFVLAVMAGPGTVLNGVDAVATSHPAALVDLARFAYIEECV